MRNYKSGKFEDSHSFSGRVHCTRYQISAGANAPAAPVLDPPLLCNIWCNYFWLIVSIDVPVVTLILWLLGR